MGRRIIDNAKNKKNYKKSIENKNEKKKTLKIKPWLKKVLFIVVPIVILIGAGTGFFFFYLRSINHTINSVTTSEVKKTLAPVESPQKPVSVLVLGIDTRDSQSDRGRADTIMLLYLDPRKNRGSLLSIPRDTLVEIPGHGEDKINAAYAYGGEELMIKTVSQFLDAEINHYITIDFEGFVELIDALGGVSIVIDRPLIDPKTGANFSAGTHHLTGEQALSYTRSRSTELGDIGRIQRQQHLFRELVNQKLNAKYLSKLSQYLNIMVDNTRTDLDILNILKYSRVALSFSSENFETAIIPSYPDWIENGTISVQIPDIEEARQMWKRIIRGEPASKYNALYFELEVIPDSAAVDTYYNFKLKAKNTGAITWTRSGSNPFLAGYHWIDFENKKMVVFDGDRAFLSKEEVNPGEEVEFELKVKTPSQPGKYILQIELVQEGITWFSYQGVPPLEKYITVGEPYGAIYDDFDTTPKSMEPGEKCPVKMKVKNTGFLAWRNDPEIDIRLGYHWLDRDTREVVVWDDGRRMLIGGELKQGEEITQDIYIFAPSKSGRYILQYDMVHERVTWFSQAGVTPLEINVNVGKVIDKSITTKTYLMIYNGNGVSGTASKLKDFLEIYGFKIKGLADAYRFDYETTIICYTKGNKSKAEQVALLLNSYEMKELSSSYFVKNYGKGIDVAIVLGKDYQDNLK